MAALCQQDSPLPAMQVQNTISSLWTMSQSCNGFFVELLWVKDLRPKQNKKHKKKIIWRSAFISYFTNPQFTNLSLCHCVDTSIRWGEDSKPTQTQKVLCALSSWMVPALEPNTNNWQERYTLCLEMVWISTPRLCWNHSHPSAKYCLCVFPFMHRLTIQNRIHHRSRHLGKLTLNQAGNSRKLRNLPRPVNHKIGENTMQADTNILWFNGWDTWMPQE